MSAPEHDPYTREDYDSLEAALLDAQRVLVDLEQLGEGRTLILPGEYEFLAKRARQLVTACLRAHSGGTG